MKIVKRLILLLVILCCAISVLVFVLYIRFGGDYGIALPMGYEISRIYGSAFMLVDKNSSVIIQPGIDSFFVKRSNYYWTCLD